MQRENIGTDKTPARHKLWNDLGVATTNAAQMGLERVVVIEDLLRCAENLCQAAQADGEDLSALQGLLS